MLVVLSEEVDRRCAWWDHEGGRGACPVSCHISIRITGRVMGICRARLIYENDIFRHYGTRVYIPIVLHDNVVGSTRFAGRKVPGHPLSLVLRRRGYTGWWFRWRDEFVDKVQGGPF